MTYEPLLDNEQIDPVLVAVVRSHWEKVIAWTNGEPGAWGYLAGQGVTAVRRHLGRPLADGERRLVWSRLWWFLEQIKARSLDNC